MAKKQAELTPYTGKHSAGPASQKTDRTEPYKGKGHGAPASELGGSLKRKGKHELDGYGGCKK